MVDFIKKMIIMPVMRTTIEKSLRIFFLTNNPFMKNVRKSIIPGITNLKFSGDSVSPKIK